MKILLTGGAGYIGSHTALAVLAAGHQPVLLDDFSSSSADVVDRLSDLAGHRLEAVRANLLDKELVASVISSRDIQSVIHFAARKSVAESVADPLLKSSSRTG